jgi:hypothetical protein
MMHTSCVPGVPGMQHICKTAANECTALTEQNDGYDGLCGQRGRPSILAEPRPHAAGEQVHSGCPPILVCLVIQQPYLSMFIFLMSTRKPPFLQDGYFCSELVASAYKALTNKTPENREQKETCTQGRTCSRLQLAPHMQAMGVLGADRASTTYTLVAEKG